MTMIHPNRPSRDEGETMKCCVCEKEIKIAQMLIRAADGSEETVNSFKPYDSTKTYAFCMGCLLKGFGVKAE